MTPTLETPDVCIIGGGFAGMNVARLLARKGVKCQIYTSGTGSSRFWAGTVDFLNKEGPSLEKDYNQFREQLPAHPYHHLQFMEAAQYLEEFFTAFPEFDAFKEDNLPRNEMVLTTLGTQKPCIGAWGTIFRDFSAFQAHTMAILVDFREFNNSVMHLVAKGLADNFEGKFKVLHLSFTELVNRWEHTSNIKTNLLKLNENQIAQYFDKYADRCETLADLIHEGITDQLHLLSELPICCVLFPPVLGVRKTRILLQKLTKILAVKVGEFVAFSPSLISQRFYLKFEEKLNGLGVTVQKGSTLLNVERKLGNRFPHWICTFEDASGSKTHVTAKYVVFATGSLFNVGCVSSDKTLRDMLERYTIPIPNPLTSSFEFIAHSSASQSSLLFTCGSATYMIRGGMTDEEEIQYCTGLGLSITTSAKVAEQIIVREASTNTIPKPHNEGTKR